MRALHQFVPYLNLGAVATHLLEIQRTVRSMGWRSEVFAGETQPPYVGRARHYTDYGRDHSAHHDDVLLYHLAIGSPIGRWLMERPEPLVVDYHNVTPFEYFTDWHPDLAADAARGRRQVRQLASRSTFAMADSEFNRSELEAANYPRTAVVPILLDLDELDHPPDPATAERLHDAKQHGGADWLFVGRVTPNKAQHDIVAAFAAYRRAYDPRARLHLVGGSSPQSYFDSVRRFADQLDLGQAVNMTGSVTPGDIAAYYRAADVFVCLSEHEGFCVPLLEAWHHGVAVVALAAAAVPETLGPAGILLHEKSPTLVAAAVHRVVSDDRLRAALVAAGAARIGRFSLERSRRTLVDALTLINDGLAT